ncbi:MAG: hypothetical protein ACI9FR_000255 [Cryomorphaceae bacterium]
MQGEYVCKDQLLMDISKTESRLNDLSLLTVAKKHPQKKGHVIILDISH